MPAWPRSRANHEHAFVAGRTPTRRTPTPAPAARANRPTAADGRQRSRALPAQPDHAFAYHPPALGPATADPVGQPAARCAPVAHPQHRLGGCEGSPRPVPPAAPTPVAPGSRNTGLVTAPSGRDD